MIEKNRKNGKQGENRTKPGVYMQWVRQNLRLQSKKITENLQLFHIYPSVGKNTKVRRQSLRTV